MMIRRGIQRERLHYIEFLALFTGQVSRKDLVSRFGISEPAATKDLSVYADFAPNVLRYDLRQRCYIYSGGTSQFIHSVEQSLFSLAGDRALSMTVEPTQWIPSWISVNIKRPLPLEVVTPITRAIFQRRKVHADYTSLTSGLKRRELSPLALVHDGLRWHVRCFDHEHESFRDYSLTRFQSAAECGLTTASLNDDDQWSTEVTLRLKPHPQAAHPETIALDYDMDDGYLDIRLRVCIVGYFLQHWHVDYSEQATGDPRAQQLILDNRSELMEQGIAAWLFRSNQH